MIPWENHAQDDKASTPKPHSRVWLARVLQAGDWERMNQTPCLESHLCTGGGAEKPLPGYEQIQNHSHPNSEI